MWPDTVIETNELCLSFADLSREVAKGCGLVILTEAVRGFLQLVRVNVIKCVLAPPPNRLYGCPTAIWLGQHPVNGTPFTAQGIPLHAIVATV
jgi:hypothetical protein